MQAQSPLPRFDNSVVAAADNPIHYELPLEKALPPSAGPQPLTTNDAKRLFAQGYKDRHSGNYEGARANLEKARSLAPNDPDILRELGLTLLILGQLDEAEKNFQLVLEIVPYDLEAELNLAKIAYWHNNLEHAKQLNDDILSLYPDNEEARKLDEELGKAIANRAPNSAAMGQRPTIVAPTVNAPYLSRPDMSQPPHVAADIELQAEKLLQQGKKARIEGHFDQARTLLDQVLSLLPNNADALVQLGLTYMSLGDIDAAKSNLEAALEISPTYVEARLGIARIAYWEGDLDKAKNLADMILSEQPDNVDARNLASSIEEAKSAKSADMRERPQVTDEDQPAARPLMEEKVATLFQSGREERNALRFTLAKQHLSEALMLSPDNPDILVQLGLTLLPLGEIDDAEKYFKRALEIAPTYAEASAGLARIAYWRGDLKQAKALGEMSLSQSPQDGELQQLVNDINKAIEAKKPTQKTPQKAPAASLQRDKEIGRLSSEAAQLVAAGQDFAQAELLYTKAVRLAPHDADLFIKLGNVQAFQQNFIDAEKNYDQALAIDPDAVEAYLGKVNSAVWRKNFALARNRIDRLLARYPDNEEVALANGQLLLLEKNYPAAIEVFENIIAANANSAAAWIGVGDGKRGLLNDKQAYVAYQQAQHIAPTNSDVVNRLKAPIRKRWRLDADTSYSKLTSPYKNWGEGGVALTYRLSEKTSLTGRIGLSRRFDMDDQQIELGVAHQFGNQLWGYLSGVVTPEADFLARYIIRAGGSVGIGKLGDKVGMLNATLDMKSEWYDNGVVKTITPGLRQAFLDEKFVVYAQWINVFDQWNQHAGGYMVRAEATPIDWLHIHAGYSDTLESSGDRMIPTTAIFGGAAFDISEDLTVGFNIAKEERQNAYNRKIYGISLTRRF